MSTNEKNKKMKEIINYLDMNAYFHRQVIKDGSSVYKHHVIVRLDDWMKFDERYNEIVQLDMTLGCNITYSCTVGGNYIMIEIL